ncbi:hypothetical protein Ahy_B01g055696 [Arachis hypogaea]|uniref:FAR1 domain-containing protein n=1 Tax=Arachis hypogaea TaxID=3818 RepID=A0A445AX04_ARAHY|nr:hypothetical protein Ahy_B01g055696 [Arachis hypogaea]
MVKAKVGANSRKLWGLCFCDALPLLCFLISTNNEVMKSFYYKGKYLCVVNEQFVTKIGITFKTLDEAEKFYKNDSKLAGFSTKIRNTIRNENKIKNQLITCNIEKK